MENDTLEDIQQLILLKMNENVQYSLKLHNNKWHCNSRDLLNAMIYYILAQYV